MTLTINIQKFPFVTTEFKFSSTFSDLSLYSLILCVVEKDLKKNIHLSQSYTGGKIEFAIKP